MPEALPRTATCAGLVDAVHHADVAHMLHATITTNTSPLPV